jgi:hypothetical protein
MKEATIGSQSREKVISAWPFKSSAGTTTYETQLHSDGVITCNCPGWVRHVKPDLRRECKHCREVKYEATQILQGRQKPIFKNDQNVQYKTIQIEKKVILPQVKVVEKIVEKIIEKKVFVKSDSVEIRGTKRFLRAIPQEE